MVRQAHHDKSKKRVSLRLSKTYSSDEWFDKLTMTKQKMCQSELVENLFGRRVARQAHHDKPKKRVSLSLSKTYKSDEWFDKLTMTNQDSYVCFMKLYHVYILKCKDGSYYTGVTNNIERRLVEHQMKENPNCYTATRLPIELVFYECFGDINQAIAFEKQIKGWRRAKKEALIAGRWDLLPALSQTAKNSLQ